MKESQPKRAGKRSRTHPKEHNDELIDVDFELYKTLVEGGVQDPVEENHMSPVS